MEGFGPPILKKYRSKIISVERFHNDCAYISLGHCIDDEILLLDISCTTCIAVSKRNKGFLGDYKGP